MKHLLFVLLAAFALPLFSQTVDGDPHRIAYEFIIQAKPGQSIKDIAADYTGVTVKRNLSPRMNIWLVERNTVAAAEEFLSLLRKNEKVKLAQFNHHIQSRAALVPNDTFFNLQWNMLNTGQNGGTPGSDIDATEAWGLNHNNITVNGDTIVVAVIDVSYDLEHEDINFFRNYHEIPGNDIDDDGNGYIDDYEGWNPLNSTGNINSSGTDPHSMHIAGIVGAIGDNHIGVAGVCWGVKVLRLCGSGAEEDVVVAAYDYVLTMRSLYNNTGGAKGAFIVSTNTSFGVDNSKPEDFPIWCAMYDSLGAVGVLSAGATNNSRINVDTYFDIPTTCPSKWLISVTNTDNKDRLQAAYGKESIDLSAPGQGIYSTYSNNGYNYRNGTSMATPHVAGAVAAMYAAACPKLIDDYYAYPDSIALLMKQWMLDGTSHLSSLHNLTVTGGRLNLYHAIKNVEQYNCNNCSYSLNTHVEQPVCSNSCDGLITINVAEKSYLSFTDSNLCAGYYPIILTDSAGCTRYQNIILFKPDSILITSIQTAAPKDTAPGNIIIAVNAGQYAVEYSLDGITYQPTSIFSVDSIGNYTLYIRNENGCVLERTIGVFPDGIDEVVADNANWNIYPNPASDVLNITFTSSENTSIEFIITNILGETLYRQQNEIGPDNYNTAIFLNSFQSGIYFLTVKAEGFTSKKFVIAR